MQYIYALFAILDLEAVRLVDHLSQTVGLRYYIVSSSCGSGALVLTEGAIFASFLARMLVAQFCLMTRGQTVAQ